MRTLAICLLLTAGCQHSSTPSSPPVEAEAPPEPALVTELVTKKMPIAPEAEFADSKPTARLLLEAPKGKEACLKEVFADENRIIAGVRDDGKCGRQDKDSDWSLYPTDGKPKALQTFRVFSAYSDELDAIFVRNFVRAGKTVYGPGKDDNKPPFYNGFVRLSDGHAFQKSTVRQPNYAFVEGETKIVATDFDRDARVTRMAILDAIPTGAPELPIESAAMPSQELRRDGDHITFRSNDCRFGMMSVDGSDAKCVLERIDGPYETQLRGGWFFSGGYDTPMLVGKLASADRVDPAAGTCAEPVFPPLGRTEQPHVLIGCMEGPSFSNLWLWTPEQRFDVIANPWRPDRSFGEFVSFSQRVPTGNTNALWLDLARLVYWDVGPLYLTDDNIAIDVFPLEHKPATTVYLVDDEEPQVVPLGIIDCPYDVHITYRSDDIVAAACMKESAKCDGAGASAIDHGVTFDLKNRKRVHTDHMVIGATKSQLILSDSPIALGGTKPCETHKLSVVDR